MSESWLGLVIVFGSGVLVGAVVTSFLMLPYIRPQTNWQIER